MSELTQLKDSVLTQANDRGQARLEKAQQEHAKDYQKKKEKLLLDRETQRRQRLGELKNQHQKEIQQIKNQERLSSLTSKQAVLQGLFGGAVDVMNQWSGEEQLKFVHQVLALYEAKPMSLQFGELTRAKFNEEDIASLTKAFPQIEIQSETIPREGGFVLSEGKIDYNYLYQLLVDATRDEINLSIAQQVFDEM